MAEVPDNEKWKLGELDNLLLGERVGLENEGKDVKRVHALRVILDIMNSSISCKCLPKICKPLLVSR